ncbi:MAG TPA: disulfide bond formation protein B, partial [Longimicrobiales bacterium]|nr:disulfide bond formation protein B [Longimicrobiales bacterium]
MRGVPEARLRTVLAWAVILLTAGPLGTAVILGVGWGESPCILCWAQRTSMALLALTGIFVLRYGPRPRYLGTVVILGAWGLFMALRHSALHLARDVGQGFAGAFFGVHTYVWSWVIHWVVLLALGGLLILLREETVQTGRRELGRTGSFATVLFMAVMGANALHALITTGPPPFMGQADPLRFSWDPSRWVWLMDDEIEGAISLRGSWTVPAPDPAFVDADPDPAGGPLSDLPVLAVARWERVGAPLDGRLTDLAFDAASGRFLAVTDGHGAYLLDGTLSRVLHGVTLDRHFAVELTPLAGATFLGDTAAVVSTNKSYVLLRADPTADEDFEWRHFTRTTGGVTEVRRSRLATVRARQMYVLSAAYDATADELITVTVPSPGHRRLVVSRFDRQDLVLSSEFTPRPGPGLDLASPDRS